MSKYEHAELVPCGRKATSNDFRTTFGEVYKVPWESNVYERYIISWIFQLGKGTHIWWTGFRERCFISAVTPTRDVWAWFCMHIYFTDISAGSHHHMLCDIPTQPTHPYPQHVLAVVGYLFFCFFLRSLHPFQLIHPVILEVGGVCQDLCIRFSCSFQFPEGGMTW